MDQFNTLNLESIARFLVQENREFEHQRDLDSGLSQTYSELQATDVAK